MVARQGGTGAVVTGNRWIGLALAVAMLACGRVPASARIYDMSPLLDAPHPFETAARPIPASSVPPAPRPGPWRPTPASAVASAAPTGAESGVGFPRNLVSPDYYMNFIRVPVRIVTSPFRAGADEWLTAALIGGGVGLLFLLDEPFRDFWQDDARGGFADDIAGFGESIGDFYTLLPAAGVGYAAGALFGDRRLQSASLESVQSLIVTVGAVEGLKHLTHRRRPNESPDDAFDFSGPSLDGDKQSFISGHAAYSFSVAAVFAETYRDSVIVPPLAYGLAGLVAWSRVNDDKHWITDVAVGGLVGAVIGKLVHRYSPFRGQPQAVSLLPWSSGDASGIQVRRKF
jgi:membrane-associated phospholipid phosphatase